MRKEENEMSVAMRAGFTLIEILVAVSIIGILGAVATVSVTQAIENSKITAAEEGVRNIASGIVTYNLQKKKYPNDIKDLIQEDSDGNAIIEGGEGALEDPFGNEYKMEKKGKKYVIISAGPDGEFGTDDDIRSDKKAKSKKD